MAAEYPALDEFWKDKVCDVCGASASSAARDLYEHHVPGADHVEYTPMHGNARIKWGCNLHKATSVYVYTTRPMMMDQPCEVCGAPSAHVIADYFQHQPPGAGFASFSAVPGGLHYGCALHKPKSQVFLTTSEPPTKDSK